MTKFKQVYYVIISIVTIVFLALAAYILAGVIIAKKNNQPFSYFGHSAHYVTSDSMSPEINIGDVVIIKKIDIGNIKVGDDVLYIAPEGQMRGKQILHRVKAINENGSLVTSAIRDGAINDPYSVDQVLGVRIKTSTILGKMYVMFTTPSGIVVMAIVLIAMIVICKCISNIVKSTVKKEDEKQ